MKKIKRIITVLLTSFIFIAAMFQFQGCEVIDSEITEIIEIHDYINYFVDLEASGTTGTENTEFIFTANTNDIVESWIIDGVPIVNGPIENIRAVISDNELIYSFISGSHTIAVTTQNGATDEIEINVDPVETVFTLSAVTRDATTEIYLDYPILTISGVEYDLETIDNIETTEDLNITETEYQRIINLNITVDFIDSFCFVNDNAWEIYGIDLNNMSIDDMTQMIEILFPERYVPPEPVIPEPEPTDTYFSLTGINGPVSDYLTVYDTYLEAGANVLIYSDYATYADDIMYVALVMTIDNLDSFLFVNDNMYNFFGIDMSNMSFDELVVVAEILNLYPETGILDLQGEY